MNGPLGLEMNRVCVYKEVGVWDEASFAEEEATSGYDLRNEFGLGQIRFEQVGAFPNMSRAQDWIDEQTDGKYKIVQF